MIPSLDPLLSFTGKGVAEGQTYRQTEKERESDRKIMSKKRFYLRTRRLRNNYEKITTPRAVQEGREGDMTRWSCLEILM